MESDMKDGSLRPQYRPRWAKGLVQWMADPDVLGMSEVPCSIPLSLVKRFSGGKWYKRLLPETLEIH